MVFGRANRGVAGVGAAAVPLALSWKRNEKSKAHERGHNARYGVDYPINIG